MSVFGQTRRCHVVGTGVSQNKIWGDTQFLAGFIPNITEVPPVVATKVTSNVGSFRRRKYPGDSGYSVAPSTRSRLNKIPAKGGGSLPGRNFAMAVADEDGNPIPGSRHQFTYQGSFADLKVNIEGLATADLVVYSPTGHPHLIVSD
jgi:hypothetical protein